MSFASLGVAALSALAKDSAQVWHASAQSLRHSLAACVIDETETCSLASLSGPTLVSAVDGPLCYDGSTYEFLVRPGGASDLLLHFHHDGLCIPSAQPNGKTVELCAQNSTQALDQSRGAFVGAGDANPFSGSTVVEILGCSGDMHSGDSATRTPSLPGKAPRAIFQKGYRNAKAAVDWAKRNFAGLRRLTITGSATGAWGASIWAEALLSSFAYESATLVVDWLPHLASPSTTSYLYGTWGTCATPLGAVCEDGLLLRRIMFERGEVAFGLVQSKEDRLSAGLCALVAQSLQLRGDCLPYPETYLYVLQRIRLLNAAPNFVAFFLNGFWATPLSDPEFYLLNFSGTVSLELDEAARRPIDWLRDLAACDAKTSCIGEVIGQPELQESSDTGYCDANLLGKMLSCSDGPSASSAPSVPKAVAQRAALSNLLGLFAKAYSPDDDYTDYEIKITIIALMVLVACAAIIFVCLIRQVASTSAADQAPWGEE